MSNHVNEAILERIAEEVEEMSTGSILHELLGGSLPGLCDSFDERVALTDRDKVAYYTRIVSVWNNPNHNAFPPTKDLDLGYEVEEQRMSPLQPFYGDTIFEGRSGQTIRLSSEKHPKNIYTDNSNKGKPFIIISNGQVLEKGGNNFTVEDINKDDSTIFITSLFL